MHNDKGRYSIMPKPITRVQLKCQSCQKAFEVHAHRAHKAKYCSRACYREARFRTSEKCPCCGKPAPTGRRFCSTKCWKGFWARYEGRRYQKRKAGYNARQRAIIDGLGGKCKRCGQADPRCLDIDHIDSTKKLRPKHRQYPTSIRIKLWEREMDNLQVLCANCHRIKTWEDRERGRIRKKV